MSKKESTLKQNGKLKTEGITLAKPVNSYELPKSF
jgi:hypothetical protein